MIPSCSHTGTPSIPFEGFRHFTSSTMAGSASLIKARTRASDSPRQAPSFLMRESMRWDGESPPFAAYDALFDLVDDCFIRIHRASIIFQPFPDGSRKLASMAP